MVHEHLHTNIKHGAICAMKDVLNARLVNDNLTAFMRSWEGVLSGMISKTPKPHQPLRASVCLKASALPLSSMVCVKGTGAHTVIWRCSQPMSLSHS